MVSLIPAVSCKYRLRFPPAQQDTQVYIHSHTYMHKQEELVRLVFSEIDEHYAQAQRVVRCDSYTVLDLKRQSS